MTKPGSALCAAFNIKKKLLFTKLYMIVQFYFKYCAIFMFVVYWFHEV